MINEGRERGIEKRKDAGGKRLRWGIGREESDERGNRMRDDEVEEGRRDAGGERDGSRVQKGGDSDEGREQGISDGDAHEGMMKRGMKFCRCRWEVMVKERRKQGVKDEWSMNKGEGAEEGEKARDSILG